MSLSDVECVCIDVVNNERRLQWIHNFLKIKKLQHKQRLCLVSLRDPLFPSFYFCNKRLCFVNTQVKSEINSCYEFAYKFDWLPTFATLISGNRTILLKCFVLREGGNERCTWKLIWFRLAAKIHHKETELCFLRFNIIWLLNLIQKRLETILEV